MGDCHSCPVKEKCIKPNVDSRIVTHYDSCYYSNARDWYTSKYGRTLQKLRGTILEGTMGQAKAYHGMARAKFRGLAKVEIQFILTAIVINLKKMVKILDAQKIKSSLAGKISNIIQFGYSIFRRLAIRPAI